ncbi:N-acetylmuramoyl-L-alanine amidase family protein [Romboutsia sp.]|uniref:N-acetylmuramoyl-L-alanine amidase family protein n=1 Tax=Romboutsia sp. TaxID=1965302 RepID=UPI003F35B442
MSKNNNKKTKKKRIRKGRLLIVILLIGAFIFAIAKGGIWAEKTIKNIQDKKNKQEVEKTVKMEQFDLEEEVNKDLGKKYTVLVDPGHGGNDKGTMNKSKTILEKEITLQIGKRVANKLSHQKDVQVIISRTDDKYISPGDRARLANEQGVDVLVSIHLNAEGGGNSASGVETYYRRGAIDESKKFAESVQKTIKSYIDTRDRGIKEDIYQVLRDSDMPAILIECGFLTNPGEIKNLQNAEYQDTLAEGITQGVLTFLDEKSK